MFNRADDDIVLLDRDDGVVRFDVADGSMQARWGIEFEAVRALEDPWFELFSMFDKYSDHIMEIANRKLAAGKSEPDGTILVRLPDVKGLQ